MWSRFEPSGTGGRNQNSRPAPFAADNNHHQVDHDLQQQVDDGGGDDSHDDDSHQQIDGIEDDYLHNQREWSLG